MSNKRCAFALGLFLPLTLGGCGILTPEKDIFVNNSPADGGAASPEGHLENAVVDDVKCELSKGIWDVMGPSYAPHKLGLAVPWLMNWGASVTLKITVEEQGSLSPGVSLMKPFANYVSVFPSGGNVLSPQSFSLGLGLSGSANATRVETIAFTYTFKELLADANNIYKRKQKVSCNEQENGIMINSDLKIAEFIYDKASIAELGEASSSSNPTWPPYTTFQDEVTFVATYGGNVTPTWHFAKIGADPTGTLLNASRMKTNDVLITLGAVTPAKANAPAQLSTQSQNVHNAALIGGAAGTAVGSQAAGH
jgi:hypothetical protein